MPEHHFQGYSPTGSAPFEMAAFLAGKLKQAWLGMSVIVVPYHHPVHMVEQMNLLDQLTRGKVLFGMGSGLHAAEGLGFGLQFDYQIRTMSRENLAIAEALWDKQPDDPPVSFETPVYKGTVLERIVPAPYRKRRPLMMGVAAKEASILRAAANGWPVFAGGAVSGGWAGLRRYREELAAAGHPPEVVARCMDWTTDTFQGIFIADTDEEAFADMMTVMTGHERFNKRQWPYIRAAEKLANVSAVRVRPPANDPAYYRKFCLWGNPDTVAARLRQYDDIGLGNMLLCFNNGLFEPDRRKIGRKTFDLFVKEVMPRFKDSVTPIDPLERDLSDEVVARIAKHLTPTAAERERSMRPARVGLVELHGA
jgi:alkanesulfonate monooxygenase SsuD/methylene tetrahydromethanopterin reductase-like flavin-dependent oxidoreductase (luciferase family)